MQDQTLEASADVLNVINLDSDKHRLADLVLQLKNIGYGHNRIGGVRGLYLPNLLVARLPGAAQMERGTLGCLLSHVAAWEAILRSGEPAGFVLEDDTRVMPWFPKNIAALIAGSGYDLVFCNQRIQMEEHSRDEDLSGEPLRFTPLLDRLLERSAGFRAPGGEGYGLTRAGAQAMLDNVSRLGARGDIDWFMVMCGLSADDRGRLAHGTAAMRYARRLAEVGEPILQVKAGVLSPYLVRHEPRGSSRKRDNAAGADLMAPAVSPLNATAADPQPTLPAVAASPAEVPPGPPRSDTATVAGDQDSGLGARAAKLRTPEREKFYNWAQFERYRTEGKSDIRPPHPPFSLAEPVDWTSNPYNDRTWTLYFHTLGWVYTLAFGVDHTEGEEREAYLASMQRILMSNVDFLLGSEFNLKKLEWDDHATGYRCSNLSYFYARYLHDRLSGDERSRYVEAIRRHLAALAEMLRSGAWKESNHLLFHVEGIGDAWFVFREEIAEADAYMDLAHGAAETYLDASFSEDGTTGEHASYYQTFLMRRVLDASSYFAGLGRPLKIDLETRLKRAAIFLWSILPSWAILPSFGDTQFEKPVNLPLIAPYLEGPDLPIELRQWREPDIAPEPPRLLSYHENGFHLFRNRPAPAPDALYSLFLEKRKRGPHGHWDGGSFMTWYGGEPYLVDSGGPYKYGDQLRYRYFQTQLAHNTVLFQRAGDEYRTEVIESGVVDEIAYVASIATFKRGDRWLRVFGHAGPATAFALDVPFPVDSITPIALFHLAPGLKTYHGSHTYSMKGRRGSCQITYALPSGPVPLRSGTVREELPSMLTRYDTQYEENPLLARWLPPRQPALTVFSFGDARAERAISGDSLGLEIKSSGRDYRLDLSPTLLG